jgi:hypothetical protein
MSYFVRRYCFNDGQRWYVPGQGAAIVPTLCHAIKQFDIKPRVAVPRHTETPYEGMLIDPHIEGPWGVALGKGKEVSPVIRRILDAHGLTGRYAPDLSFEQAQAHLNSGAVIVRDFSHRPAGDQVYTASGERFPVGHVPILQGQITGFNVLVWSPLDLRYALDANSPLLHGKGLSVTVLSLTARTLYPLPLHCADYMARGGIIPHVDERWRGREALIISRTARRDEVTKR